MSVENTEAHDLSRKFDSLEKEIDVEGGTYNSGWGGITQACRI